MRKELFEFRHIAKHIGGHAALRDVSLRLYQDEITFLVGRGSGRSVLSRLMTGELAPDSGTMLLLEKPYQPLSPEQAHERGIFCVTQDTKLIQNLSLSENIYIARPLSGIWHRGQAEAFARMACQECGIQLDLSKRTSHVKLIDTLMVYCLRALLVRARLLILDNLLYLLSEEDIDLLFQKLKLLKERGVGILAIEPVSRYALRYGDRTVFFSGGRISADFFGREYTAEMADILLNRSQVAPEERVEPTEKLPFTRDFFYPAENGIRSLQLAPGEVVCASCHSPEQYQRYLDTFFHTEKVSLLNRCRNHSRVSTLTFKRLQSDYFLDLSFAENVVLPAYVHISAGGRLTPGQAKKFLRSELSDTIPIPSEQWGHRLSRFDNAGRELAVLYRMLMENVDILVFAGIMDQPNMSLMGDIWKVIFLASEMGKSVLMFHRNYALPMRKQDRLIFLDEPEGPRV